MEKDRIWRMNAFEGPARSGRTLLRRLLDWLTMRTVAVVDNIAHGLTGAVIGYCGFRQRGGSDAGRAALWPCVAAAEFPDIDVVLGFFGRDTFFRFHRSFTHSAVMLPVWAALIAWTFWELSDRKNFRLLWRSEEHTSEL